MKTLLGPAEKTVDGYEAYRRQLDKKYNESQEKFFKLLHSSLPHLGREFLITQASLFYIFIGKKDLKNSVVIIWSSGDEESSNFNIRTGGTVGKEQ